MSNPSKSPPLGPGAGIKRRKTVTQEKKIADDEFMASAIGDVEWLKQSLRANKGAVTFDKNGLSPIHLAAIHGRSECLKLLVEKFKFDVNLGSTTGWRPAHLCISNQTGKRAFQCLSYLLEKGADPSMANDDGITPMHQAASEGHVQCLKALIDAGGNVTGVDARGHSPLDLAKLWGHRKCARLLATEKWQAEKQFLAKEMKQLQKIKIQQAIEDMEKEDELQAYQAFYGDKAFKEWLDLRGLSGGNNGPPPSQQLQPKQTQEELAKSKEKPKESVYKANSYKQPAAPSKKEISQPPPVQRKYQDTFPDRYSSPYGNDSEEEKQKEVEPSEASPETAAPTEEEKAWYNPDPWNKSTFVASKPYVANLPDHYPHDEYTMKPKHPPKRERKKDTKEQVSLRKMPQLPQEVIDQQLNPGKYERPVVYKCKHIADVDKKLHFDPERLPRQEAGLHLMDDLSSYIFKAGLQNKGLLYGEPVPSSLAQNTMKKSSVNLERIDAGVVNLVRRMNKPDTFPNIKGNYYVIGSHG